MFLHIGGSKIVYYRDILGIFNLNLRKYPTNKQFLEASPETRFFKASDFESYKSFIVTADTIYLSPIAPVTLARRKSAALWQVSG
jgi:hypothetical protein